LPSQLKQKASQLLRSANLRRTGPRLTVLTALLQAERPMTQEQIAERLGKKAPNKVTIYRALEKLAEAGLVHKAFVGGRTQYFELSSNCTEEQCHPHFTCTSCGNTYCLVEAALPIVKSPHKGFVIFHQQVRLEGLCPDCA